MKTKHTMITAPLALSAMLIAAAPARADMQIDAKMSITPRPRHDLEVYVWPDRGEGGAYYPGDRIYVNVEVNKDAFLILYNIDTRGRLNILFPADPWEDNFVSAGEVIEFPRYYDDVDWTVEGPSGTEYIQAIASEIPIGLPEWPIYRRTVENGYCPAELNNFHASSDRIGYIDVVNRNITGRYGDWCATDLASFYVQPRPVYRHINYIDPWPDVFYGSVYIGWPIGSRIFVDGIFIGTAPCYIPRYYTGRRIITCFDGPRLIRRQVVECFSKRDYYKQKVYVRDHGNWFGRGVRKARGDAFDHFQLEKGDRGRARYRALDKKKVSGRDDAAIFKRETTVLKNSPDTPKRSVEVSNSRIDRDDGAIRSNGKREASDERKSGRDDVAIKRESKVSKSEGRTKERAAKTAISGSAKSNSEGKAGAAGEHRGENSQKFRGRP